PRSRPMRLLRRLLLILLIVAALPYVLVPVYRFVPPVSTLMIWRWGTGARVERVWQLLDDIAPALPLTVIAAEDARFCSHRGVDWASLREALGEDDPSDWRGGSTITQQTVKNLFLWQGRSYVRKALEL